ncbi:MAG: sulfatase [Planctomycetes bacterium]|nr:sulfatase [Planctomycetota bacterium]
MSLLLFVALAACLACGKSKTPHGRPNLLLVSVDCLRADHLSCYGYARETSPAIDQLAREGVRFEHAFSASGWTVPSHLSMLTGLPMSVHGIDDERLWMRYDEEGHQLPVPMRGTFVSEVLHEAGYATAGFFTAGWLGTKYGFGPGFDTWERLGYRFYSHPVVGPLYEKIKATGDVAQLKQLRETYPELFDAHRPSTPETVDRAIQWVEQHERADAGQPFFLFMHLFDAHEPYAPPPPFDQLFQAAPGAKDIEVKKAAYDGEIRGVDAGLARLFARLETLGLAENTLIVLTGDHGEEFEEHGFGSHRIHLFCENIHVPLVMRWPAGLPAGRAIGGNAGHIDIAATLCAAAGVKMKGPVLGTDLLPIARGEVENSARLYLSSLSLFLNSTVPQRYLTLIRGDEMRVLNTQGTAPWAGVRFDLAQNPSGSGPGIPLDLGGPEGERLQRELAELRKLFLAARAALPARGEAAQSLSPSDLEEIKATGYAGAEATTANARASERLFLDGGVWPDKP